MNTYYDYEQRDNSYILSNLNDGKGMKVFTPKSNFNFGSDKEKSCENLNFNYGDDGSYISNTLGKQAKSTSSVNSYLDRRHRESQQRMIKLKQKIQIEEKNVMTFKPKISNNSRKIVEKLMVGEDKSAYNFHEIISQQNKSRPIIPNPKSNYDLPVKVRDKQTYNAKHSSRPFEKNLVQNSIDAGSKRGISCNQSISPYKINTSVQMPKDPVQEDYKKIIQNRSYLLKPKGSQTPNKFQSASQIRKNASSRTITAEKAKIRINDQSSSVILNTSSASVHLPSNHHLLAQASYSKINNSINPLDFDKAAYNIFKAQPVEKIVDARSKLNYFYKTQGAEDETEIKVRYPDYGQPINMDNKAITPDKRQICKVKTGDGLCSYTNYQEGVGLLMSNPPFITKECSIAHKRDLTPTKSSESKNINFNMSKRLNDLDHLKSFADKISNTKNQQCQTQLIAHKTNHEELSEPENYNKSRPLDFTLGGGNKLDEQSPNNFKQHNSSKDEILYSIPRQSPESLKQKSDPPHPPSGNGQYKLNSESKEYLFQKLSQMKCNQITNY